MTDVIEMFDPVTGEIIEQHQLAEQLLKQAKEQGVGFAPVVLGAGALSLLGLALVAWRIDRVLSPATADPAPDRHEPVQLSR